MSRGVLQKRDHGIRAYDSSLSCFHVKTFMQCFAQAAIFTGLGKNKGLVKTGHGDRMKSWRGKLGVSHKVSERECHSAFLTLFTLL